MSTGLNFMVVARMNRSPFEILEGKLAVRVLSSLKNTRIPVVFKTRSNPPVPLLTFPSK